MRTNFVIFFRLNVSVAAGITVDCMSRPNFHLSIGSQPCSDSKCIGLHQIVIFCVYIWKTYFF